MLQVYGHYLNNGGKPEDFMMLNHDDVQIMYIVQMAEQDRMLKLLLESLAKIMGAEKV